MKQQNHLRILLATIFAVGFASSAGAALVTVNSTETWDGVSNPHAGDGVTISGSGTEADPVTYTIPNGMHLTSTGRIVLHGPGDYSIRFVIQGGDLQMDAGAVLNVERYDIRTGRQAFVLDLSGTNNITGAGQIGPITLGTSNPRVLTITNVYNVSLTNIDLHTSDVNRGGIPPRDMAIVASGAVFVAGIVDNSDQDASGDGGGGITIKASSIDVNNLDTRGMRSSAVNAGNVLLQALSPFANYDPIGGAFENGFTNKTTVRGVVNTRGPNNLEGNVTMQSVVLQLVLGVIRTPNGAVTNLQVGDITGGDSGAAATNLFMDISNSGLSVQYVVGWSGPATLPAGNPPVFTSDSIIRTNAVQDLPYAATLAGSAVDADPGAMLAYAKGTGPAWLKVAPDGTLSGTPSVLDAGTNSWLISVTDGTWFDTTTLNIFVAAGPRWNDGDANFAYPDGLQDTPYSDTLARMVLYSGTGTLVFSKLAGPAWLTVAADGTLSGTPAQSNTLENVFTVSVTDGTDPANATLRIFVNGSPKFVLDPFSRASVIVGEDYALRNQTLAGSAVDPQGFPVSYSKLSGPSWLSVFADGALSGTPGVTDVGTNLWTVSADDGTYPASTATLKIVVEAGVPTGAIRVVSQEYWDGVQNPHVSEGVTLTGDGSASDPATYTIPRELQIVESGSIYLSPPSEYVPPKNIRFVFQSGGLTMDSTNNLINTGVHDRQSTGKATFTLDLGGTNDIAGSGQIIGLSANDDTPRTLTITNVNNVRMASINLQVRNVNNTGRPLFIYANGTVEVSGTIDNSDQDTGGEGSSDVNVFARTMTINHVDTRFLRNNTPGSRLTGKINLRALAPPAYDPSAGGANSPTNQITVRGTLVSTNKWPGVSPSSGAISCQSVILRLESNATLVTAAGMLRLEVGKIQGSATAADLFVNQSGRPYSPAFTVDWSGAIAPARPTIWLGEAPPGKIALHWTGTGFVLQQNSDLANTNGWAIAPTGTNMPAILPLGPGQLYFRLKWPE